LRARAGAHSIILQTEKKNKGGELKEKKMKTVRMLVILVLAFIIGLTPGVAKAKLVACVGDSITYGWGISNLKDNSYPAQLAKMLQQFDSQWETQNFGVSCWKTPISLM
jgi:lysophospholipase L1-like esterase